MAPENGALLLNWGIESALAFAFASGVAAHSATSSAAIEPTSAKVRMMSEAFELSWDINEGERSNRKALRRDIRSYSGLLYDPVRALK